MAIGQWLRRRFVTGLFVAVPLVVSVSALVWIFGIIDGFTAPLSERILGRRVPGLGFLIMVVLVLGIGVIATNVIGRRVVARAESWLTMIPVFRTIYTPVKQLIAAFSPDNEYGFKQVVMVEDERRGLVMGFLTKEFRVERGGGPETMMAVYVPTNHLYLGDIVVYPRDRALLPGPDGRRRHPDFPDWRHVAAERHPAETRVEPSTATTDDLTTKDERKRSNDSDARVVQGVWAGGGAGRAAAGAGSGRGAGPAARSGGPAQEEAEPAGGEANLVLPDLGQTDVGGYNGRSLLMIGLVVSFAGILFGLGHPEPAEEHARAPVDARDLGADLRDLQDLPDHAGPVPAILELFIAAIIILYFGVLSGFEPLRVGIILLFSVVGILGSYGVAWFGIRVNTYANSRTAFASLKGLPLPVLRHPAQGRHEHRHAAHQRRAADHAVHPALHSG